MSADDNKVLVFPDLKAKKGIPFSRVHVSRLVSRGQFQKPFRLGAMTIAWTEAEIDAWILERISAGNEIDEHTRATAVKAAQASAVVRKRKIQSKR